MSTQNKIGTVDRRRFLLGLAAASTAAATAQASAAPTENPKLIKLANALPAVAATYHEAYGAYEDTMQRWRINTPLAPDEFTEIGTGCPRETRQPGETEVYATNSYLYRKGEKYPRRIVRNRWTIYREIDQFRRIKRAAKKNGAIAEFLNAEEKLADLKILHAKIREYEDAYRDAKAACHADHERLYPIREKALHALADHVSAIMAEPDWTMEGLIIKAETLIEWDRLEKNDKLYAHILGSDWHASIAAAILRHGDRGAA